MNWRPTFMREERPDPDTIEAEAERAKQTAALLRNLRDTRVLAGLSLSDVERDTRINRVYLEAIEEGRFQDIPAPVYARGFVRSYARYLGLDAEEAVAAMPDLPPPLGLEPMPGLRRTITPLLPAINAPVAGAIAAAIIFALLAYILLPNLGGGPGLELPADGTTATETSEAGGANDNGDAPTSTPDTGEDPLPANDATVPPFEEGIAPDFSGVPRAEAQAVLANLEVTPLFVDGSSEAPAGVVFDQTPSPGTEIEPGDVITIFVSTGP